jgi:hypothetical protein
MPYIRYVRFDVPKNCKLRQYSEQLMSISRNTEFEEDFVNFRDQLFHDCFAFVRSELKTSMYPIITVDFVPTQAEYESLEKRAGQYVPQRQKPKIPTLGFTITSSSGNRICINFEPLLKLLETNSSVFIFNLVSTLIHEILHCFFRGSKDEQETYNLQCQMLERFLGVTLPTEMKETKTSDFYDK